MARILIFAIVFFLLVDSIVSNSNQEDLRISNYFHIGCLTPYSAKEFVFNHIQENTLLPYQTFSSSNLTVELCFRLCRRWIILLNSDHTNCICLYTINEVFEIHEHLGEVSPLTNCTNNSLEIYSITQQPYILTSAGGTEDWSFEGCYYIHGIQTYRANLELTTKNYTQALNECRKYCQLNRSPNYISFFLSLKKFCYCLPIQIAPLTTPTGLRKPLIHCSFLPEIQNGFTAKLNISEINSDTVAKINLQRYCSASFRFARKLYSCLRMVPVHIANSYTKISTTEQCSPVLIQTLNQWKDFLVILPRSNSSIYVWVDRKSSYLFDDLFKSKTDPIPAGDICLVINQALTPISHLISCSDIRTRGDILCAQKPIQTVIADEPNFTSAKTLIPIMKNITCPPSFILFDNLCYYVGSLFVYSIKDGEQLCADKYVNSALVTFKSQEWGNVNSTRFLGRALNDILLEFFYHQIEKQLSIENGSDAPGKHRLRLLIGDRNNSNPCVLRYFTRSAGAFTFLHRCSDGGHPVCQSPPIAIKQSAEIDANSTTTDTPSPLVSNSSSLPLLLNETIADEDLQNNETTLDMPINGKSSETPKLPRRSLLLLIIGPILACVVLLLAGIIFLSYCRGSRGSYSPTRRAINLFRRPKRSLPVPTTTETTPSNTPAVLYSRLQSSPPPEIVVDADMVDLFDDNIQLLPSSIRLTNVHENAIVEETEEPLYATLKLPDEK